MEGLVMNTQPRQVQTAALGYTTPSPWGHAAQQFPPPSPPPRAGGGALPPPGVFGGYQQQQQQPHPLSPREGYGVYQHPQQRLHLQQHQQPPRSPVHAYQPPPLPSGYQQQQQQQLLPSSPTSQQQAKVVTIVCAESGEQQCFRICAGEQGEDIRAALRGAFGLQADAPFALRDASGCNIVLGYPSVVHGAHYEMRSTRSHQHHHHHPQQQQQPPEYKKPFQTVQPTAAGTLQTVHLQAAPSPSPSPSPSPGAPRAQQARYQEMTTSKPAGKEAVPGAKNKKHSQHNPMPGAAKALLVGIGYVGQKEALTSPGPDLKAMRQFLGEAGFHGQQLVLTDDVQGDPAHMPTRENILRGMAWLVGGAKAGETLFLHFSGHGVEVRDQVEEDRYDEAILPVNFRATKPFQVVRSDEMTDLLVSALPHGVRLVIVCDCAHSGSLVQLPFTIRATKDGCIEMREKLGHPEVSADVVMLSGWRGEQTTDSAQNALTSAFIQAMAKDTNPTYESLVVELRNNLYQRSGAGYQVPQIMSSKRLHLSERFYLCHD